MPKQQASLALNKGSLPFAVLCNRSRIQAAQKAHVCVDDDGQSHWHDRHDADDAGEEACIAFAVKVHLEEQCHEEEAE